MDNDQHFFIPPLGWSGKDRTILNHELMENVMYYVLCRYTNVSLINGGSGLFSYDANCKKTVIVEPVLVLHADEGWEELCSEVDKAIGMDNVFFMVGFKEESDAKRFFYLNLNRVDPLLAQNGKKVAVYRFSPKIFTGEEGDIASCGHSNLGDYLERYN